VIKKGFFYFFRRSLTQRKGRFLIASISVTFSVMIITGLLGITSGIRKRMGEELRSYGANMIVTASEGYMESSIEGIISGLKGVADTTPQLIDTVFINDTLIEAIGVPVRRLGTFNWRITGRWPQGTGEVVLGVNLKYALKIEAGKRIRVRYGSNEREFLVTGFFERGGPEDNSIIMEMKDLQSLTGLDQRISIILVRGQSEKLEEIKKAIESSIPGITVKTVRQVAGAEESLLRKIQLLMTFVTLVVLFATSVSVASTMGANVLEKREEIGLMKALGARRSDISLFYMTEAVLIGLSGGIGGFILGTISLEAISKVAFNAYIDIPLYLPLISLLMGLIVASLSSYFPVRDAMRYNPAIILRGE